MTDYQTLLRSLSEHGDDRTAGDVFAGARRAARRYRRRRATLAGVTVLALLAGTLRLAAGLDGNPDPIAARAGGDGPSLTGVRIEPHEPFDRIVMEFDADVLPDDPLDPTLSKPPTAACQSPPDLGDDQVWARALPSAVAPTPDGLPAGIPERITGDGEYVEEVVLLCAADGVLWFDVVLADIPLPEPPGPGPVVLENYWGGKCLLGNPGRVYIDFWLTDDPDAPPPSPDACPGFPQ